MQVHMKHQHTVIQLYIMELVEFYGEHLTMVILNTNQHTNQHQDNISKKSIRNKMNKKIGVLVNNLYMTLLRFLEVYLMPNN